MNPVLHARNRFGLGARPGEGPLASPRGWLLGQLQPGSAGLEGVELPDGADAARAIRQLTEAQRSGDDEATREARRGVGALQMAEARAALGRRVTTGAPFLERLVAFWSNHLCISTGKAFAVGALAGLYERQVIRLHVLGRFSDMVLASARHPAMLLYLDNFRSVGPGSPGARRLSGRRGQARGLNENYARELLELHTLGVEGGYTQEDVEQLARILTGWTLAGGGDPSFRFRPALHEPGDKRVLGVRYREAGEAEGERVIRDLCRHPATARFLATKLARHFVADDPPAAAVTRLEGVWLESEGDLGQVSRALVDLPEAWDPGTRKFRPPQEWLVAVLRAVGATEVPAPALPILRQLRQPLWAPPSPQGYLDTTRDWADPDGLLNRGELARTLARRVADLRLDPRRMTEVVETAADDPLPDLLADAGIPPDQRLALAFASPAFQWR